MTKRNNGQKILAIGFIIVLMAGIAYPVINPNQISTAGIPHTADVPAVPVLNPISINPTYDARVYMSWNAVAGATSYKVYRNATQITSTVGQTLIGTTNMNAAANYTDTSMSASGTYWYAVVASNASGDSAVSNSVSVAVVLNNPSVVFYDDLGASTNGNMPTGWSAFQDIPNICYFFAMVEGSYAAPNRILYMTDNQAGERIYGNATFSRAITSGNFTFGFIANNKGTGNDPRHYDFILQDAQYNPVITATMTNHVAAGNNYWSLQGAAGSTLYPYQVYYTISIAFSAGKANLSVNGVTEPALTNVAYSGGAIAAFRIAPEGTETGGEYMCEAPFIAWDTSVTSVTPAAPALNIFYPNPTYGGNIYVGWNSVPGATSYKVYRDTAPITTIGSLTPVGTPTTNEFVDALASNGTYWYAVVANNASGDSPLSNTQSVQLVLDPNTAFWEDFSNGLSQWASGGQNGPSFMFFQVAGPDASYNMPSPHLLVSDNQASQYVWGNRSFTRAIFAGDLKFSVSGFYSPGSTPESYFLYLQTTGGSTVITVAVNVYSTALKFALQGVEGSTSFSLGSDYKVEVQFTGGIANLLVNGTPLVSGQSYTGSSFGNLRIDSYNGNSGFYGATTYFDDILVTANTAAYVAPPGPALNPFYPNPTYGGNIYVGWNSVPGATSYKVYRDTAQISTIGSLTPVGTPTTNEFVDVLASNGTYWYAVVANNASGDSPLSNSQSVQLVLDPNTAFWEDFSNGLSQWASGGQNGPSFMFFQIAGPDASYNMPSPHLLVSDNQASQYVWGNRSFTRAISSGDLKFSVAGFYSPGSTPESYFLYLQTTGGSTVITVAVNVYSTALKFALQGVEGSTSFSLGSDYKVEVQFAGGIANLLVNGTPLVSGQSFTGSSFGNMRIDSYNGNSGFYGATTYFDDILVTTNTGVSVAPSAPTLTPFYPNPTYGGNIYVGWNSVPGATSYKVYRDTAPITTIGSLTPVGTPTTNEFVDALASNGTYWYAVVANNASGDSPLSNTQSVQLVLDPNTAFWEDFSTGLSQWASGGQNAPSFMFFQVTGPDPSHLMPSPHLQVSDNQASQYVWGNRSFTQVISAGDLTFSAWGDYSPGSTPESYFVYLQTPTGSTVITVAVNVYPTALKFALQGTEGSTSFSLSSKYKVEVQFTGGVANLLINGTPLVSGISYTGSSFGNLRIDSYNGNNGFYGATTYFDDILVTNSTVVLTPPAAPILSGITPNLSTNGIIGLNWSNVVGATSYKIYRNSSQITTLAGLTPIATTTMNWSTDGVLANGTYWYAVVATNASGDSLPSNSVNVTVGIPPAIPQNGVMFTIDIGIHDIIIRDANGNILFELSINVSATVQMTVTVSTTNPSLTYLSGSLSYFKIDVQGGKYTQIVAKFYYDSSTLKPGQEDQLDVLYLGTNGWEAQHGQVYKNSHYVLVNLAHFSTYAVAIVPASNTNNGIPTEYILITVFAGVALVGVLLVVKMRKPKGSSAKAGGNIDLDWDW